MSFFLTCSLLVNIIALVDYIYWRPEATATQEHHNPTCQADVCETPAGDKWNWATIDTHGLAFPKNFLWGVATSGHQIDGKCTAQNCSWCAWEESNTPESKKIVLEKTGIACDHWNRYQDDIKLMQKLGINTYRFSIEWGLVQPTETTWDEAALKHYVDLCRALKKAGIKPAVTLHYYTEPVWFAQKGGFEKADNIHYFVDYCTKLFTLLHNDVELWFTFNSPGSTAAKGYLQQSSPPAKNDMQLMVEVMRNILEAHVETYHRLKGLPGGPQAQIGIIHTIYQLEPYRTWNPQDKISASMGNKLANQSIIEFFKTGVFAVSIPFKARINYKNARAINALDMIGLNYYSHTYLKGTEPIAADDELKTDSEGYTVYPEGLYRAIAEISQINKPIYVTENGVGTNDDELRDLFLRRYLYALSQALHDGYDVRGYYHWTFMDSYEWGTYKVRYGLYHVDFAAQKRTLKKSAQYFIDTIKRFS